MRRLLEPIGAAACVVEPDGRVVACNERAKAACGSSSPGDLSALLARVAGGGRVVAVLRDLGRVEMDAAIAERRDRLAMLGQMTASAVHDMNNVLTAVLGWSQMLSRTPAGNRQNVRRYAAAVEAGALKTQRLIAGLTGIVRGGDDADTADVPAVVRDVVRLTSLEMERRSIRVVTNVPEQLDARIRKLRLFQVLLNLVQNSAQAASEGGEVRLVAFARDGSVVVRVEDTGPGMDAETLSRVFDPFFTTKRDGGTGLGLYVAKQIVEEEAGGVLTLSSVPGGGTVAELRLRPAQEPGPEAVAAVPSIPAAPRGLALLVVEGDSDVGTMIATAAGQFWKAQPVCVGRVAAALDALRERPFTVCVLDADLLGEAPNRTLDALSAAAPGLRILLTVGRFSWEGLPQDGGGRVAAEIKKPFTVFELLSAVSDVARST